MELIKQKQTEKQQQQRETKQQKTTKQKQNLTKQQNKTTKTKPEHEKANIPKITMYLTKNTNNIEARAAALEPNDYQVNVTNKPSKVITSASSIKYY